VRVFVGGVAELFQGDLDLGRLAAERLLAEPLRLRQPGLEVVVEELHYGAVAVAQRLEELRPTAMILVGAVRRGRPPGSVQRRRVRAPVLTESEMQTAVADAVTGYVGVDLVVEVASTFGVLPARTVALEVEPESVEPGATLSGSAARGLETILKLVRSEVGRVPVLELADEMRPGPGGGSPDRAPADPVARAMDRLLEELCVVDDEGRWGQVFARRDQLRLAVAEGAVGPGMEKRDWALMWGLVEELDRVQAAEMGAETEVR
jgi:hypothetical protein